MIDNSGYIFKGIMLVLSGLLIGFFPQVIVWIFYAVGGIIIIGSVFTFLGSLTDGEGGMFGGCVVAGLIGAGIMMLPRFITIQIPLISGIVFAVVGISRLFKAFSKKTEDKHKLPSAIMGILLTLVGLFFMFNTFKVSKALRIVIGLIMIGLGVFDFVVAHFITQRNNNSEPVVVDVDNYTTVDGDTKEM